MNIINKLNSIYLAVIIFITGFSLRLYILFTSNLIYDDFFITLRVAKNFASGNGLVFNLNEFIYPITSIPYTILCSLFIFLFEENAVTALKIFGGLLDSFSAVVLFFLVKSVLYSNNTTDNKFAVIPAFFGGLSYAALSTVALVSIQGMESSIYVLCIVLFFFFYQIGKNKTSYLLAAIIAMIRPDGVLIFAALVLTELWITKKINFKNIIYFILPYLTFLISVLLYYGTVIPQPVIAKSQTYSNFVEEWLIFLDKFFISPKSFIWGLLFITGSYFIIRKRLMLIVLIWGVTYAVLFSSLTKWWAWYFPPFVIAYLFAASLGFYRILEKLRPEKLKYSIALTGCILFPIALAYYTAVIKAKDYEKFVNPYYTQSTEITNWIKTNTCKSDKILIEPLGLAGYLALEHTFTDYPGIASKEVTNAIAKVGRKVAGSPIDYEATKIVLEDVNPAVLILRETEYEVLRKNSIIDNYELKQICYIDTTEIKKNYITQDMFILKREVRSEK